MSRFLFRWWRFAFSPNGRTNRLGYLTGWLLLLPTWFMILLVFEIPLRIAFGVGVDGRIGNPISIFYYAIIAVSAFALVTRRLRDAGWSTRHAWWIIGSHALCVATNDVTGLVEVDAITGLSALAFCIGWSMLFFIPSSRPGKAGKEWVSDGDHSIDLP